IPQVDNAVTSTSRVYGSIHAVGDTGKIVLSHLRDALPALVSDGQVVVAIPFDGPIESDTGIGYFGNPGLAVVPLNRSDDAWIDDELVRARSSSLIPFQTLLADDRVRALFHGLNPFDVVLVPRELTNFKNTLVQEVVEPTPNPTPYALVVNHW